MSREPSSAPAWIDPFAEDVIRRVRYVAQLDARGLQSRARGQEARAKSLGISLGASTPSMNPRREIPTNIQAPRSLASNAVPAIDENGVVGALADQPVAHVHPSRELTVDEEDFLDIIDNSGGLAKGRIIAEELGCSPDMVKTLAHRLWKIGAVEITRRGYMRGNVFAKAKVE